MTIERWVALVKEKEARQCALVIDDFERWTISWWVERVQTPERYCLTANLTAKLREPEKGSSVEDWKTLGRITQAFGSPRFPPFPFPEDPTAEIHWRWDAPAEWTPPADVPLVGVKRGAP